MTTLLRILAACLLGYLAFFTSTKLLKMARIRGFIEGPPPVSKIITNKVVLPDDYGDSYWIAWDGADILKPSKNRLNLSEEAWGRYSVGDPIQVFLFPGETWAYSRENVYASDDNFVFDFILLSLWLGGLLLIGYYLCTDTGDARYQRRRQDDKKS